jgi:hypothetical protein
MVEAVSWEKHKFILLRNMVFSAWAAYWQIQSNISQFLAPGFLSSYVRSSSNMLVVSQEFVLA